MASGSSILRRTVWILPALLLGVGAARSIPPTSSSQMAACPQNPPAVVTSSSAPSDVCVPDGFTAPPVDFFDDYSWRTFVALVWPAAPGKRGLPNSGKKPGEGRPLVFETYKSLWEVFHDDGSAPATAFGAYDPAARNACHIAPKPGDLVLGSASGVDDIGQAGVGMLEGPLVAQNGKYVRYLTLFNQAAFDFIVKSGFYLRKNLPSVPSPRPTTPVLEFPNGSIVVKSAWVETAGLPDAQVRRMYTRDAYVQSPNSRTCARATVALVGLHVIQKTPSRPQWIWSSFEQEDNVPPARPNAPGTFTFHDGSQTPMPRSNPLGLVPLAAQPAHPFNVTRAELAPVHTNTVLRNFTYQDRLAKTPWRFYKVVMTQWPRLDGNQATPVPARLDGSITNTFPGLGAISAFTNVTMETFDQGRVQLGCMSCHNETRLATDFVWTVFDHAYPSRLVPSAMASRPR